MERCSFVAVIFVTAVTLVTVTASMSYSIEEFSGPVLSSFPMMNHGSLASRDSSTTCTSILEISEGVTRCGYDPSPKPEIGMVGLIL